MTQALSRRSVLAGAGALIVAFPLSGARAQTETGTGGGPSKHGLPGSLDGTPRIDAWIRIDASGGASILTGKAELGQGLKTALLQVAAEELIPRAEALESFWGSSLCLTLGVALGSAVSLIV